MAELAVRPGWNDASVVGEALAGDVAHRLFRQRRTIDRLVVDAHLAVRQGDWARLSQDAAVPLMIDPMTSMGQRDQPADDVWTALPYGRATQLTPDELLDPVRRRAYVRDVVNFQLNLGASGIVAPYFYAGGPDDPWFELGLLVLRDTAEIAAHDTPGMPVTAVWAVKASGFTREKSYSDGVDRFAREVGNIGASMVAALVSPISGDDGLRKIMPYYASILRLREISETRTMVWRQGIHGPALVAAGVDGYETGAGQGESTDLATVHASRWASSKRRDGRAQGKKAGGSKRGVYLEPLGRSIPHKAAAALLGDVAMRPLLMCDEERCCSRVAQTLEESRLHALRARSRQLHRLEEQPSAEWRLFDVRRKAFDAEAMVNQANDVLASAGVQYRLKGVGYKAIAETTRSLAEQVRAAA